MLQQLHWYARDIQILRELGFSVVIANRFGEIPWGCDLYFSWWASGSILPLSKAFLSRKPIITIAGGHEATLTRDPVSGVAFGYTAAPWYTKLAVRICLRYSTQVLVVSDYLAEHAVKLGALNPLLVYNCVDTEAFRPLRLPRTLVSSVFNCEERKVMMKRGDVFLRSVPFVLRDFPQQKFVVIGSKGNAYQRLQQLTSDLGVEKNVEFIGTVDNAKMPEFLNRSKVFVQISESETFGVAIAEAMSCETPVVVSKQGPIPEVVGDCGIYVDHNNPKAVAAAIANLLGKTEDERREIGLKARFRIVENFSYGRRKKSIQQIISSI